MIVFIGLSQFIFDQSHHNIVSGGSGWRVLTGNELGILLGHWQIQRWKKRQAQGKTIGVVGPEAAVLASVVSSRMLRAIAAKESIKYYDTLTGK